MAKHIKTNKIKKRKAAKKTLRKTKRIRQKGKKQSGGLWGKSSECSDTKTATFYTYNSKKLTKKLTKELTEEMKEKMINNIKTEMIKHNLSNITSKLHHGKNKQAVAKTIVTDAIQYWLNALNGSMDDRKYFGRSNNDMFNPLIKICIMKEHEEGAAELLNPYSGFFRSGDRYVKLKHFEEKYQFKNYEKYQSEPQPPQKNTDDSNRPFEEFKKDIKQKYENYNYEHPEEDITAPVFDSIDEMTPPECYGTYNDIKEYKDTNYENNKYYIIFHTRDDVKYEYYRSKDKMTANQINKFVEISELDNSSIYLGRKKPWPIDSCNN